VLCNVKNNAFWHSTVVHELGHALYDQGRPLALSLFLSSFFLSFFLSFCFSNFSTLFAGIGSDVPFLLKTASHILTTEGIGIFIPPSLSLSLSLSLTVPRSRLLFLILIAMLFGSFPKIPEFLERAVGLTKNELERYSNAATYSLVAEKLIFSRWAQVMLRFERSMYENPDQDLNKLWW
jgi:hypothetical protein